MSLRGLAAMCLAGTSLFFFSAPLRAGATVERSTTPNGASYIELTDDAIPTTAMELWFRVPSIGFGTAPQPGIARYAATAIAASKLGSGTSLSTRVQELGGRLSIGAYPDAVSVAVSVPAASAPDVMKVLTDAYFSGVVTTEGMHLALRDLAIASTLKRFDPEQTLHDDVFAQLFASGPAHYPALPDDVNPLQKVKIDDLRAFVQRGFRSSNAVIAVAGGGANLAHSVAAISPSGTGPEQPVGSAVTSTRTPASGTFAEDGVGFGWSGPPIADARAATAMDFISDYLFNDDTGLVTTGAGAELFVSGQFVTLHDPGVMIVSISGKGYDAMESRALDAIQAMQRPLDAATFAIALAAFEYRIAGDVQTPLSQADNFGWYAIEGNPSYAPSDAGGEYLRTAASLDPQYVAQVAKRYLENPVVVHVKGTQPK